MDHTGHKYGEKDATTTIAVLDYIKLNRINFANW